MTKKKLLLITNHMDDVFCFRRELIVAFVNAGYDMIICCPNGDKFDLMQDVPFQYDDVEIDRRGKNPLRDGKLFFHYLHLIRKERPDFVLTYTIKPNIYADIAARICHVPCIANVTGLGSVQDMQGMTRLLIVSMLRFAFRKNCMVFFQNQENMDTANELKLIHGEQRLIPGSGVNTERFCLQPYPQADTTVFNYIGRVLSEKGVDDYLDAAQIIHERYPDTEFNVIGFIEPTENTYQQTLKELEDRGIVFYRGNLKDVRPAIARSHATIHPSCYGEGMSNVLLESASSGRPLITTDISGCKEIVISGETGYLYPHGNVPALVACIEQFLRLSLAEKTKMGQAGRDYVKQHFSRDLVIAAYLDVLMDGPS